MYHEVMRKWVAALRSGEYTQIDGRLRSVEPNADGMYSYCVLGVLCDLHRKEHNPDGSDYHYQWEEKVKEFGTTTTAYANHYDTLPASVREWAGIKHSEPDVVADPEGDGTYPMSLTALNDDYCFEFPALAELIEAQWMRL